MISTNRKYLKLGTSILNSNQKYTVIYSVLSFLFLNVIYAQQITDKLGHKVLPYTDSLEIKTILANPDYDLETFPLVKYEIDSSLIKPIKIGDTISDEIMNMVLTVVSTESTSKNIKLSDLAKDKLIIIDFWASWCGPCIESMEKWENYATMLKDNIVLLGAHIDYDYKAYPFIKKRNWKSSTVVGLDAYVLNRHFFDRKVVSRIVWIKNGKLRAITGTKEYDLESIEKMLKDDNYAPPSELEWTYGLNEIEKSKLNNSPLKGSNK